MHQDLETYTSLDAERAVLGTVLLERGAFGLTGPLTRADFADQGNAEIWDVCAAIAASSRDPSVVAVTEELRRRGCLRAISDLVGSIEGLTLFAVTLDRLDSAVAVVRELSGARAVLRAATRITVAAARKPSPRELQALALTEITEATRPSDTGTSVSLADAISVWFDRRVPSRSVGCVSTTLRALDTILRGGLRPGQLMVLAARPAMGKTSLALGIALGAATRGPVHFSSLEMTRDELSARAVSLRSQVPLDTLASPTMSEWDTQAMVDAAAHLSTLPLTIDDSSAQTFDKVRASALRAHAISPLALVVIDHLHLIRKRHERTPQEEHLSDCADSAKALAKELGCPAILLAQLNRECEKREDKRPVLADLRGSGSIEAAADAVVFIYRDEVYNKRTDDRGVAEISVAKQRNGPIETARVRFHGACTRFADVQPEAERPTQTEPVYRVGEWRQ